MSRLVLMGVAGSGKSTLAAKLARRHGATFVEADDLHSTANREQMASGSPLADADRWPWLAAVRHAMRAEDEVVVACSALKRRYRDALRAAGNVRFLYLEIEPDEAMRRIERRTGHYMTAGMLDSQFAALESPAADELDIATIDASAGVDAAEAALVTLTSGTGIEPLLAIGAETSDISAYDLRELVAGIVASEIPRSARRILLVPPDHTRLHSRAGEITALLFELLTGAGCEIAVLPALGTHTAMSPAEVQLLLGDAVPFNRVLRHRWRDGLVSLGEIAAEEISALSDGRLTLPIPVEVDETLLASWDLVVSVGQVVPHEVIGMANFTKNLVIGLGGSTTINRSHFLGAVCDLETIMGHAGTSVRDVVDAAFDRFLAPRVPVLWLLTVTEDTPQGIAHRGLFVGTGGSGETGGAAFRAAAALSLRCNISLLEAPLPRVACWLDPDEFRSTWLGNKAVYRTRMAIADGGELIVLAPGVARFGEDDGIDRMIRRHGYHGTKATLDALDNDPDLAQSLGAAAHLIQGSSEGRFRITYCTDPANSGLSREEVEGVGYGWRPLGEELRRLDLPNAAASGERNDRDGLPYEFVANPSLGLWATADRFA